MAGAGFLGLGGTGFGNFMTNIWEGAGDLVEDVGGIVVSAPNRVNDFSRDLANIIYGGAQKAQDSELREDLEREAGEYYSGQYGRQVGQQAYSFLQDPNLPIYIGIAVIAIVAIMTKD